MTISKSLPKGYKLVQELVRDPGWQELRKSFIGTWMISPQENCRKLRAFLGGASAEMWGSWEKLRIVLNYLTGSGFRSGRIRHPDIDVLLKEVKQELSSNWR